MSYESNIFKIENLRDLSTSYRLLEIEGIDSESEDFDSNIQYIIRTLSFSLKHPITVIQKDKIPFLVIKDDCAIQESIPKEGLGVKRGHNVFFKDIGESFFLDFITSDPNIRQIILRFLQFDLNGEIDRNRRLWSPKSGEAFYSKTSRSGSVEIEIYNGFMPRIVDLDDAGFGISIDITKKYVDRKPLNHILHPKEFKRLKWQKRHLIYRYGQKWYEIIPHELSKLPLAKYMFDRDGVSTSLLEDIRSLYNGTMPPYLAELPDSASVIIYRTNELKVRGAVSAMCFQTYDTSDPLIKRLHRRSIIDPFYRRRQIRIVRNNYLRKLRFGNNTLKISSQPYSPKTIRIAAPDLLFNKDTMLSTNGNPNANSIVTIDKLGYERKRLLTETDLGFYTNARFGPQYLLIPESVHNTFANEKYFVKDLKYWVNKMHKTDAGWKPIVIPYDDRNKKDPISIGIEILKKLGKEAANSIASGHALAMLPSHLERDPKMHDEAAAMVVSDCDRDYNIRTSIMHTATLKKCFNYKENGGKAIYYIHPNQKRLYRRYLIGIAINQVLLNNERWPFVLSNPLNTDLVIGIDVKRNIAGFTFVDKYSKNILPDIDRSNNKERLSAKLVSRVLTKNIHHLASKLEYPINSITIHRDGRLFQEEINGIKQAITRLTDDFGVIQDDVEVNLVEIPKNSKVPFRLFSVQGEYDILNVMEDNGLVLNPEIGTYTIINESDAYVCTTGREFTRPGTSKPLLVRYRCGKMKFEDIIQDLYYLTHLTFTKPDDCSRNPLSITMTDKRINLLGSDYDQEEAKLQKTLNRL